MSAGSESTSPAVGLVLDPFSGTHAEPFLAHGARVTVSWQQEAAGRWSVSGVVRAVMLSDSGEPMMLILDRDPGGPLLIRWAAIRSVEPQPPAHPGLA